MEVNWNSVKFAGRILARCQHKVYFGRNQDRHEYGVGFLVHKDIVLKNLSSVTDQV